MTHLILPVCACFYFEIEMNRNSNNLNSLDFTDTLKCPITFEFFRDPVIGTDGHTYERENITAWIQKHGTSPITRETMSLNSLRPNFIVRKMVEDFVSLSQQNHDQFRLNIDLCKTNSQPLFQSSNKTIYRAQWIQKQGPPIVLIEIQGTHAKQEASFYVKLSGHPHIIQTYGLVDCNSTDSVLLAQEYAPEGALNTFLRKRNFRPTIDVILEIFRQIIDAMSCLVENQIVHGDLACRNVLIFRMNSNQPTDILVKLTDFGLTRTSTLSGPLPMKRIPIRYAAPEILRDSSPNDYSEKSDVYSFGVFMWEVCSYGETPFEELKTIDQVYDERLKGRQLKQPRNCSNQLWNIIRSCLQEQPEKRPNFKIIHEHLHNLRYENKQTSDYMNFDSNTYVFSLFIVRIVEFCCLVCQAFLFIKISIVLGILNESLRINRCLNIILPVNTVSNRSMMMISKVTKYCPLK